MRLMRLVWLTPYTLSACWMICGWNVVTMNWLGWFSSAVCCASIAATVVRYCGSCSMSDGHRVRHDAAAIEALHGTREGR
jgi:hypothetical protein